MWCIRRLFTSRPDRGDGRFSLEAGVWSMPVVLVCPWHEFLASRLGVFVSAGIGPFADGGLDEALGLAVGLWSVVASALGGDAKPATGVAEEVGEEARTVVGDHATDEDAEALEAGRCLVQEVCRGDGFFVRIHGREGDARVIVDGHVEELPARPTGLVAWIAGDAMARLGDARELLDIDVQQVSRRGVFVAQGRRLGFDTVLLVQSKPGQHTADGG